MLKKLFAFLIVIFVFSSLIFVYFLTQPKKVKAQVNLENYCRDGIYYLPQGSQEIACGRAPNCGGKTFDEVLGIDWQSCDDCWNNRCNRGMCIGEVPLCCYKLESTGDPFACTWPERGYCHPTQCAKITADDKQMCAHGIKYWCNAECGKQADGSDLPYLSLEQRLAGTQPSSTPNPTSPNPTATTAPAPTLAPCPDTLAKDSHIIFSFSADRITDDAIFNAAGGLTIVAKNATQRCKLTVNNVPIVGATQGYTTKEYVNLPNGEYSLFISGPRNLRQQFNGIILTAGQELICTGASQSADCGDIGNATLRNERKLLSGDANSDGIIDIIDFELYRQNVGHSATGNNTDFDYNGNVEYKNGVNDDFEFLKANFGKKSV